MSRRASEGSLFLGRLSKSTRVRDLEDIFEAYGRMTRCEIKYGAEMAYAFIDFEDHRDAEDAIRYENGRDICGSSIIVERAKGAPRRSLAPRSSMYEEGRRSGHIARDYPQDRYNDRGRYGARGGRYRSPSPRRRRSRSRSKDRRRRSRSRSGSHRHRSRSPRRRSHKHTPSRSPSKSKSASPKSRSASRSPPPNTQRNGDASPSRSPGDD